VLCLVSVCVGYVPSLSRPAMLTFFPYATLFPSDLFVRFAGEQDPRTPARLDGLGIPHVAVRPDRVDDVYRAVEILGRGRPIVLRSEEHASELQSRENLVCRLLLENKKNNVSKEI